MDILLRLERTLILREKEKKMKLLLVAVPRKSTPKTRKSTPKLETANSKINKAQQKTNCYLNLKSF